MVNYGWHIGPAGHDPSVELAVARALLTRAEEAYSWACAMREKVEATYLKAREIRDAARIEYDKALIKAAEALSAGGKTQ